MTSDVSRQFASVPIPTEPGAQTSRQFVEVPSHALGSQLSRQTVAIPSHALGSQMSRQVISIPIVEGHRRRRNSGFIP